LVEDFGATVLLASATQPEFWSLAQLQDLPARRIVDDPTALFERLRRVNYEWLRGPGVTWDSLAEKVVAEPQVLTVVNTTRNAASLHRLLEKRSADHVLHLSRRMTAGHRRQTIGHIKGLLKRGMPVQAVSTSLVEAGVDFDFGAVFREETLPESMQQAAGRCNRENLLPRPGKVVIFRIHEDRPRRRRPKREADVTYEVALATAQLYFGPEAHQSDPDDLEALTSYYLGRYAQQQADGQGMGTDIDEHRSRLNFQTVAEMFQMIDDDSVPVIAVHKEKDRTRIEAAAAVVRRGWGPVREAFRLLQEHTARLPHYEADEALHSGLAESVLGRSLLMWRGHYHPLRGLDPAEPEKRSDYTV
jgi:CRISPR-associated endonuclease/helicase Cas3